MKQTFPKSARLAQLVEHQTFNLRAMGSSPISGSNHIYYCFKNLYAKYFEQIHRVVLDKKNI